MMRKKSTLVSLLAVVLVVFQIGSLALVAAPKKKRILYLGDSMSMGAFGTTMDEEMRAAGFEVYTFVAGGATPYYWLSRYSEVGGPIGYWEKTPSGEKRQSATPAVPKVEALLSKYDPDVVVVQTGTNLYSALRSKRRTKADNVKEVEGLLNHMVEAVTQGGRRCYWITPPAAHPERYSVELQNELALLTKRVVGRDARVFDSRQVTTYTDPYPENDGIHYGATEAKQWAFKVARDFNGFMKVEKKPAEGLLASRIRLKNEIPKAIPVASSTSVASTAQPIGMNVNSETQSSEHGAMADRRESKRPEVQIVKKAVAVDPKGVQWGNLDLELRLVEKSELHSVKDIDYSYCFAMNEYQVLKVNSGYYPYPRIRIARVVMWGKKLMPAVLDEKVGSGPRGGWKLVPMSKYPRFEQMQLVDDLPVDLDLPVYIIAFE